MYREIVIIIVFLAGLIFCFSGKQNKKIIKENFIGTNNCPNLLLQSGTEIFLFNRLESQSFAVLLHFVGFAGFYLF